jgi:hypothetical protein
MESLTSLVIRLQSEIAFLKSELEIFKSKVHVLTSENRSLRDENFRLKERLGLTSKTSSIPSSKELYKLKRNKVKSLRNIGGQPGHAPTTRIKLPADEVIDLPISGACFCGGTIAVSSKPYIHQKVDLPDIKPYVINYQMNHGRFRKCGKRYTASFPQGITKDTFGPKIKSVVSALTGFHKNSKR